MKKIINIFAAVLTIVVTAQGFAPANMGGSQARMMAKRAAIVVAQREAAKQLCKSHIKFRLAKCSWNEDGSCTVTGYAE